MALTVPQPHRSGVRLTCDLAMQEAIKARIDADVAVERAAMQLRDANRSRIQTRVARAVGSLDTARVRARLARASLEAAIAVEVELRA